MNMVVFGDRASRGIAMPAQRPAKMRVRRVHNFTAGQLITEARTAGIMGIVGTKAAHRKVVNMISHKGSPFIGRRSLQEIEQGQIKSETRPNRSV
ncbi:hypothetical protein MIB92_13350 [Aestuariirhabdus sp. Z084]|uniref:hypothetical protein n=1 Tax=Aestuariirhabdus haliotis TaxID=2918751 RepID=UPI00201B4445|nr:hypothetical protein [Aestuariirhabdus haliotis]MCL6416640.1 hypothetical protein [Aestuariirhabdus haliotis]MCL6420675.1 hypothetical protein [Aestuariirhabdus haliotis]